MVKKNTDIDNLKNENLELRLSDVRKDVQVLEELNTSQHATLTESIKSLDKKVDDILMHVKATNGSVAKVQMQVNKIELSETEHCNFKKEIEKIQAETDTVRFLFKHPKIVYIIGIIVFVLISNQKLFDWILKIIGFDV